MKLKMRLFVEVFDVDTGRIVGKLPIGDGDGDGNENGAGSLPVDSNRLRIELGAGSVPCSNGNGEVDLAALKKIIKKYKCNRSEAASVARAPLIEGVKELRKTHDAKEICDMLGLDKSTVYTYLKRYRS